MQVVSIVWEGTVLCIYKEAQETIYNAATILENHIIQQALLLHLN